MHHQFFIYGNWVLGFLTLGCPIIAWSVDERPTILLRFPLKLLIRYSNFKLGLISIFINDWNEFIVVISRQTTCRLYKCLHGTTPIQNGIFYFLIIFFSPFYVKYVCENRQKISSYCKKLRKKIVEITWTISVNQTYQNCSNIGLPFPTCALFLLFVWCKNHRKWLVLG